MRDSFGAEGAAAAGAAAAAAGAAVEVAADRSKLLQRARIRARPQQEKRTQRSTARGDGCRDREVEASRPPALERADLNELDLCARLCDEFLHVLLRVLALDLLHDVARRRLDELLRLL